MLPWIKNYWTMRLLFPLMFLSAVNIKAKTYQSEFFRIQTPTDVHIEESKRAEDYLIYRVMRADTVLVHIYIGDQPDYPSKSERNNGVHFSSPNLDMVSRWKDNKLVGRELLIRLAPAGPLVWPEYVMVWTENLSEDDMSVADKIISSLVILQK